MEFTEFLKNISLVIASFTAVYGIGSWRREHRGKRQADIAEEALSLFYEAKDAIRHLRNPFSPAGEGSSRKEGDNETAEEKRAYNQAYVVFERYNNHIELFNRLHSIRYRFMTQFGAEYAKPFEDLRKVVNRILASAQTLAQLWVRQHGYFRTDQQAQKHFEFQTKMEAILSDINSCA